MTKLVMNIPNFILNFCKFLKDLKKEKRSNNEKLEGVAMEAETVNEAVSVLLQEWIDQGFFTRKQKIVDAMKKAKNFWTENGSFLSVELRESSSLEHLKTFTDMVRKSEQNSRSKNENSPEGNYPWVGIEEFKTLNKSVDQIYQEIARDLRSRKSK